jgi:L-cystine uptake protein TcyP (sodium:dicarboxylate symporter family)
MCLFVCFNRKFGFSKERIYHPVETLTRFYSSPMVRFILDIASYLVLVCLFSVTVLSDFGETLLLREFVLMVWIGVMTVQELYEVHSLGIRLWMDQVSDCTSPGRLCSHHSIV